MNTFDYLMVLVSIVMGLAITNVLNRLAVVVTARERVDFYWPPIAWAIWIFFISVQHWWAQWSVHHVQHWNFLTFVMSLLDPVLLFLLSALVLPEREEDGVIDLGQWYYRNRVWFFGLLFLLPLASIGEELVRSGRIGSYLNLGFLLAFDAAIAFAYALPSRRAQEWITAQAMVLTLAYVALLFVALPT